MALVQIGKDHDDDIKKLKGRLKKIEKHKGSSHATIKLKLEDHKDSDLNSTIASLKRKIKNLENRKKAKKKVTRSTVKKKSVKKKTAKKAAKKVSKSRAKPKLKKSSIEKHKHDLKKIKVKLSKLEQKKRNATLKPTLSFRTTINKLSKRIDAIFDLLEKAHEEFNGEGDEENPLLKKLDLILEQNEKIAQGILTVAELIQDKNGVSNNQEEVTENVESQMEVNDSTITPIQPIESNPTNVNPDDTFNVEQSAPFVSAEAQGVENTEMQTSASANEINSIEEPFKPVNITSQDTNITQVNNFADMNSAPTPDFQNPQANNLQPATAAPLVEQEQPREIFNPDTAVVENSPLESQNAAPISENQNSDIKGLFAEGSAEINDLNNLFTPPTDDTIQPVEQAQINVGVQEAPKPFGNVNNQNAPMQDAQSMATIQQMDAPPMAPSAPMDPPPMMPSAPMDAPPMAPAMNQPQAMPQNNGLEPISQLLNPNDLNSNMPPSTGVPPVGEQVTPIQSNTAPIPLSNSNDKIQLKSFSNNNNNG
jgi:hypothetical protein